MDEVLLICEWVAEIDEQAGPTQIANEFAFAIYYLPA